MFSYSKLYELTFMKPGGREWCGQGIKPVESCAALDPVADPGVF